MRTLTALAVLLFFSFSSFAQVCRVGCPCGNTCISCADTCRIGGGDARSDNPSSTQDNQTQILVIMGSLAAVACLGFAVAVPLMMMGPSGTASMFSPPKPTKLPKPPAKTPAGDDGDHRNSGEHVRMLLSAKCADVEVAREDWNTIVSYGCGGRWVCTISDEVWACAEDIPPTSAPRLTNDDFN